MTKTKKTVQRLAVFATLLLMAFLFTALPVYAAGEEPNPDTTGETEASVQFTAGELKLLQVPVLNFGNHPIADTEQSYQAVSAGPNTQVSDLRGSGLGWNLVVSLSSFHLEEGGGPTLQAATIQITSPKVAAVNGNVGTPPAAVAQLTLTSDGTETPVLEAGNGTGMGVWELVWTPANTTLTVKPGTAQQGKSVATLNWSLQSTP